MVVPIRIFISSPGDVADERTIASEVIENLQYASDFQGKVKLERVAWDIPGAPPLEANIPPQEAINRGLPLPSMCDIVVIIFWARMGTAVEIDGVQYDSGTEFEYREALNGQHGKPSVLVYRRDETPPANYDDPDHMEKYRQYQMVKNFFDREFGGAERGYNRYKEPEEFRTRLEGNLRFKIGELLKTKEATPEPVAAPKLWEGSPFPGLRSFQPEDAQIFFGRGLETDKLTARVRSSQFVGVVGASGSGKSSLVGAGLIPRLLKTSGANRWMQRTFTPGDKEGSGNPFVPIALAFDQDEAAITALEENDNALHDLCAAVLADQPETMRLLLFIDQFEELFTTVSDHFRPLFIQRMIETLQNERVHLVITVRGDFYGECIALPQLAELLEDNTFPLSVPGTGALYEMIVRPAERAGLEFEEGLASFMLDEMGDDPGALALLAYTLDELYHRRTKAGLLPRAAYDELGGVQGAIGSRSEDAFAKMSPEQQAALPNVFRELVNVRDDGTVTRRRAATSQFQGKEHEVAFIKKLVDARLLVVSRGENNQPYVEVAHEALLRSWDRLVQWISDTQEDLRLLRRVRQAAAEWDRQGRPDFLLWRHQQLKPVYEMQHNLGVEFDEVLQEFTVPEAERLFEQFRRANIEESGRWAAIVQVNIVRQLKEIGADAIPVLIHARNRNYTAASQVTKDLNNALQSFELEELQAGLKLALAHEEYARQESAEQFQPIVTELERREAQLRVAREEKEKLERQERLRKERTEQFEREMLESSLEPISDDTFDPDTLFSTDWDEEDLDDLFNLDLLEGYAQSALPSVNGALVSVEEAENSSLIEFGEAKPPSPDAKAKQEQRERRIREAREAQERMSQMSQMNRVSQERREAERSYESKRKKRASWEMNAWDSWKPEQSTDDEKKT